MRPGPTGKARGSIELRPNPDQRVKQREGWPVLVQALSKEEGKRLRTSGEAIG
jgi:hypothetical protein